MADGILNVTGFGRFEKLHAEYNKVLAANAKLQQQLQQSTNDSKKQDQQQEKQLSSWSRGLQNIVLQYGTISTLIRAVTADIENQKRVQDRAFRADIGTADARQNFLLQMGPRGAGDPLAMNQAMQAVEAVARRQGISTQQALQAASPILSATSGRLDEARIGRVARALEAAVPLFRSPERIGDLGSFAGATLDLQKGVPGLSEREATGIMLATQGQARIEGIENIKNFVPAAVAAQVTRPKAPQLENTLQSLALSIGIGSRLGDPSGEITRTAASTLAQVVADLTPQFAELPILDAVREISKDPKLAAKVQANVKGKGATKPAQRELFNQVSNITFQIAEEARGELLATPEEVENFYRTIEGGTPDIQRAVTSRKYAAAERDRLRSREALSGNVRSLLFGGQVGQEEITGVLPEASVGPGIGTNAMRRWLARGFFETGVAMGFDPRTVGGGAVEMFRASRGSTLPSWALETLNQGERTISNLEANPTAKEIQMLDEIQKNREAAQQEAAVTEAALQTSGAAAQGKNQQE